MKRAVTLLRHTPISVLQVAVIAAGALAWETTSRLELFADSQLLPPFSGAAGALVRLLGESETWQNIWWTLQGWAAGLVLASLAGVLLGLTIGWSRRLTRMLTPTIDLLRSVPAPALIFTLILVFGLGFKMKLVLVTWASLWAIMIQSIYGAQALGSVIIDFGRAYRLSAWDTFWRLRIPSALPFIATGIRLSASTALVVAVAAEFLGGAPGLGNLVQERREAFDFESIYALLLLAGLLGIGVQLLVVGVERRVLAWHPSIRKAGQT